MASLYGMKKNLFMGCVYVPLTKKGVEEAIEAGKRIGNISVGMIYTSALIRAQMTDMLAITQHHRKKGSKTHMGGTMRLGSRKTIFKVTDYKSTKLRQALYGYDAPIQKMGFRL